MKKLLVILSAIVMLTSCSQDNEFTRTTNSCKEVTMQLSGDFSLASVDNLTRSSGIGAADVWIFDYVGSELKQTIHQRLSDAHAVNPRINLEYDEHRLYFVISTGSMPMVDSLNHVISWRVPGDTFQAAMYIDVDENSGSVVDVPMQRIAAKLAIKVENQFPENASAVKVSMPRWFYSIDYKTGWALHSKQFNYVTDIRDADGEMEYYTLTEGNWCRTSAYMEVLTANDETLASAKIVTADLERGKCSLYSGSFAYTSNTAKGTTFNFSIPEWETETKGTW